MARADARGRGARAAADAGTDADAEREASRLHSAAIHLLRWLRREDASSGLSAPRLSALSVVVMGGPLTLGALASAEQVRPPTMSRLVDALQVDGYVVREPDPADGRATRVRATPRGERLLAAGRSRRVRALAEALAALPARDRATLARAAALLEQVIPRAR